MRSTLLTRWGRGLDPRHVLPEHPRPQLARDSCIILNGIWHYAITRAGSPEPTHPDGEILVPFSPEAPLSGVGRHLQPDQLLWYFRDLAFPDELRASGSSDASASRLLLHFGAVDQTCTVWLNGVQVGAHHGGYLPFTCDLTDAVRDGSNRLVVRVRDVGNNEGPSFGKQSLQPGGIWYTAQSGIWQTVWAEVVPAVRVAGLVLTPDLEAEELEVTVHGAGPTAADLRPDDSPATGLPAARVTVSADGAEVAATEVVPGRPTRLPIPQPRRWSPEDPFLYDVEVRLGEDVVRSYVGMRSFGVGPDASGTPRLLLNGEPYFHLGVLDQGYWPDGLMTAPSDEALVHDIATMKALGFNTLRKHIKIEPLRWYYHCDRLGMIVWQDFVNGGRRYRRRVIAWPGTRGGRYLNIPDTTYRLFGRGDPALRREFREELRRTVAMLRSSTSVAVWVPFNEGWGQFDARAIADEVRALDPTRPIDHASGWHDQGSGDLVSLHVYDKPFEVPPRPASETRVLALTEYGGYDLAVSGHTTSTTSFGYQSYETAEALGRAFTALHTDQLAPAVGSGLSAAIYTQLSDIEEEQNGLLTYDREVEKLPREVVRAALHRVLDEAHGSR